MSKPLEYRMTVSGFGTWRIAYNPAIGFWELSYNVRLRGEQWIPSSSFALAENAAIAVAERRTGSRSWDDLRFRIPDNLELSHWQCDTSDGVQEDARD